MYVSNSFKKYDGYKAVIKLVNRFENYHYRMIVRLKF